MAKPLANELVWLLWSDLERRNCFEKQFLPLLKMLR